MEYIYELKMDVSELNDFQKGRISGLIDALTGLPERLFVWERKKGSNETLIRIKCTSEQFTTVLAAIERFYPGKLISA
jgi:hypothetical protein